MAFISDLLPHLVNGLTLGLLFALVALGFMLILSMMEVINLAHGSMFALGAYVGLITLSKDALPKLSYWLQPFYALPLGWRYALAFLIAPLVVALVGMLLEVCLRRTYDRIPLYGLLLTFGASLVIEEAIRTGFGRADKFLIIPPIISSGFIVGDLLFSTYRFFASGIAIVLIALLWLFIERTPYGAIIKAGAHDSEMVRALGINLRRLRLFVFAFGAALAALAGFAMAPIWGIRPHMGVDAVIPAFVIIVLGGVGSFWGPVMAGLLVGMVVGLTGAYKTDWSLFAMYLLLIAVVTFRGRGLLGRHSVLER
jgi:branched-subunit amino acid ABC-type transport system permease component